MCKIFYKKVIYIALSLFIAVLMSFGYFFPVLTGFADDDSLAFDKTNVMNDLKSSVIEGQAFDLKTYNFDSKKELQILSFVEYGYSFYENLQGNYGLYVYVYNPQGLKLEAESELNGITIAFGEVGSARFNHFALEFLSKCEEKNYEGLFYKFKVNMSRTQKQSALNDLNSTERVYRIGQLLLKQKSNNNATSFAMGTTYKMCGYSKGYGPDEYADSTLTIARGEQQETIQLDVKPAYYRPEGSNGKNEYTRDSLHSVYFAVPNDYEEKYESMVAVHAKWLDAVLKPMIVTGNETAYKAILPYLGKSITESSYPDYFYLGGFSKSRNSVSNGSVWGVFYNIWHWGDYVYGISDPFYGDIRYKSFDLVDNPKIYIDTLYGLFPTSDFSKNSADTYRVLPSTMQAWLESTKNKYGGPLVNGKYSKAVFESVADNWTDVIYSSDYKYQDGEYKIFDLRNQKISRKWWEISGGTVTSNDYDGISCLQKVEGLTGNAVTDCTEYFLDTACYEDFKNYYNANKAKNTVYIFRYQVSDYYSHEAVCIERDDDELNEVDTNAYFFQETVNLDFTVIDLTFRNGSEYTVIPVVANPVDNIPGSTEPSETEEDDDNWFDKIKSNFKKILTFLLIGLIIIALSPLFPHIINAVEWLFKGVIWLLTLPFKLISKIIKSFKNKE